MNEFELCRNDDSDSIKVTITEIEYETFKEECAFFEVKHYYGNEHECEITLTKETLTEMTNHLEVLIDVTKTDNEVELTEIFNCMLGSTDSIVIYNNVHYLDYPFTIEVMFEGEESVIDITLDEANYLITNLKKLTNKMK